MRIDPDQLDLTSHSRCCTIPEASQQEKSQNAAPPLPCVSFAIGVTGHSAVHKSFPAEPTALEQALGELFGLVQHLLEEQQQAVGASHLCRTRLLTLLSDGVDHLAVQAGLRREWELMIPLPFGRALNTAINARPESASDARAILAGKVASDPAVASRAATIAALADRGVLFELADQDERLTELFLQTLDNPQDATAVSSLASETGRRTALAGRVLIEQSDLVIAVWDGLTTANAGGTGQTALAALREGVPVLLVDPVSPDQWRVLHSPEELVARPKVFDKEEQAAQLAVAIGNAIAAQRPGGDPLANPIVALEAERWHDRSSIGGHAFRRVEALFGETGWGRKLASIRRSYERPDAIAAGSGQALLSTIARLAPDNDQIGDAIARQILTRFAWFEAISSRLSDFHRSGMTVNFVLGACAIIGGILYLPLVEPAQKWIFAGIELTFLLAILLNTAAGRRLKLHQRWFETRRAAEYLRHSPMLCVMGVARPSSSWPRGTGTWWPEWYVRNAVRAVGLPRAVVDKAYLRRALEALRDHHVDPQREYHRFKSRRLARAHHGLDVLSERLFVSAVFVVAIYLALAALAALGTVDPDWLAKAAKWFTVLAVALPSLGGALAGIRYFGDFERFAEISEVTAERLDIIASRIDALLAAPDNALSYALASDIMRATDNAVFAEIQAWQSVFSGKIIAVPA